MASRTPQHTKPRKKRFINYPRANKRGFLRWVPSFRLILGLFAFGVFAVAATLVIAYFVIQIPKPDNIAVAQTSTVYYSDGTTPIGRFSAVNRVVIPASDVPKTMKQAIVASEDSSFYTNNGVDLRGIARAVLNNVQGKKQQGASTITMQYIENYYLGANKSYLGKVQEALLAYKIEQQADKDTILSSYLNTIYFGRGAYGIQQAAKVYFGKAAKDLTVSEAAMIAGIVPAPSAYDPAVSLKTATLRWNRVLDRMVAQNMLTNVERAELTFPTTIEYKPEQTYVGTNGYLMSMVHKELRANGLSEDSIAQGGLRVVTTFHLATQAAAVAAVNDLGERPAGNHVGITSIDPSTGGVLAIYGGPDYIKQANNNATQAIMQGGSTFKAYTLAAALEDGVNLQKQLPGNSGTRVEGWVGADGSNRVPNDSGESMGQSVSLLTATEHSLNTAFAKLNIEIGPARTREAAIKAGLPASTPGLNDSPSNVLGVASPHVIDVAATYATFAAEGKAAKPYTVTSVQDPTGTIYTVKPQITQAFSADVANGVTYALREVINSGTATGALALDRPEAGKTGTSDQSSIWFAGYTPQISTTVAMFQTDDKGNPAKLVPFGKYSQMYGGTYPVDLWVKVQRAYLEGKPATDFNDPPQSIINGSTSNSSGNGKRRNTQPSNGSGSVITGESGTDSSTDATTEPATTEPNTTEPSTTEPSATETSIDSSGNGSSEPNPGSSTDAGTSNPNPTGTTSTQAPTTSGGISIGSDGNPTQAPSQAPTQAPSQQPDRPTNAPTAPSVGVTTPATGGN